MPPLICTRGASSVKGFGFGAAAAQTASFISNINSTTYELSGSTAAVDSAGNMYIGFGNSTSNNTPILVKYNTAGAVVFQKQISVSGANLTNLCVVAVDSSDNVFVIVLDSNYSDSIIIIKMTTAGSVVSAHRATAEFGGYNARAAVFGSTLILAGRDSSSSGMCVFAYNTSSNTISWARRWYVSTNTYMNPTAIAESPNYYYVFGYTSVPNPFIFQFSKSGTLNWGRIAPANGYAEAGAADSSNNSYIAIPISFNGATYIYKYDPSYSPLAMSQPQTNKYVNIRSIANDLSGNMYLCGEARVGVNQVTSGYISKMATDMTVSQERSVAITNQPTSQTIYYYGDKVTNNNVFASGYSFDGALTYSNYLTNISVPTDGTKTGNYSVNRYPSGTYTFAYQPYTETNGWSVGSGSASGSFGSSKAAPTTSVTAVTASVSNLSLTVNTKLL